MRQAPLLYGRRDPVRMSHLVMHGRLRCGDLSEMQPLMVARPEEMGRRGQQRRRLELLQLLQRRWRRQQPRRLALARHGCGGGDDCDRRRLVATLAECRPLCLRISHGSGVRARWS